MPRKRFTPGQIISNLMEAEVLLARGKPTVEVFRALNISEQTYCRWPAYGEDGQAGHVRRSDDGFEARTTEALLNCEKTPPHHPSFGSNRVVDIRQTVEGDA